MLKTYGLTEVECAAESPDELAFLRRIADDLSAPLPKLVFADWLEERGDPRGPFLRTFVEAAADPTGELPPTGGFTRPWLDMVGIHAVVEIRKWHREVRDWVEDPDWLFDGFETYLLRLARPRLILLPTPVADADIPVGESKYGGCPDLPAGEGWPHYLVRGRQEPSYFCCQLQLGHMRDLLIGEVFPAAGLLSFDVNTRGGHARVRCLPDSEPLTRVPVPTEGIDENDSYYIPLDAGRLWLIECVDFPFWLEALLPQAFRGLQQEIFYSLAPTFLPGLIKTLKDLDPNGDCVFHQLLGYQPGMNSGPESEEEHGRFFFTFGSRHGGEQWWGESGRPFVFIRPEALAAKRFDSLYMQPG